MKAVEFMNVKNPEKVVPDFIKFACEKLGIKKLPKINFVEVPIKNEHSNSFASFNPNTDEVDLYTKNRHILDIFRSLAHELTHYKQKLEKGSDLDGSTGSNDENEANAIAGKIMREYNKAHLELF